MQNLEGIRQNIVCRLDKAAIRCRSNIMWDRFTFPQIDQEFWREQALCYCLRKMLDVRARMTGFKLMLQDDKGEYTNSGCAIIFEGSMLVYDPQCTILCNGCHVWGVSAALTMTELHMANDLSNMVPLPHSEAESVRLPSPEIIKGVLAGAESDTDSLIIDSGDKWDKTEDRVWSHCPTLMAKIGPTWAEVHAAARRRKRLSKGRTRPGRILSVENYQEVWKKGLGCRRRW